MMMRACIAALLSLWLAVSASAQTQEEGQMRLYIQELEQRIRELTGENERLVYEVNRLRAEAGQPPLLSGPAQTGAVTGQGLPQSSATAGEAQLLGTLSVPPTAPPEPMTRFNTPSGRPARFRMSASAQAQPGTRLAGLKTTVLP